MAWLGSPVLHAYTIMPLIRPNRAQTSSLWRLVLDKEKKLIKKLFRNSSRGQAIVMVAIAFVGLVSMVGLMIDGGTLLLAYANLKRGVDSASIGAARAIPQKLFQAI